MTILFTRLLLIVIACGIAVASFQGEGSPFLFPQMLAVAMILLAATDGFLQMLNDEKVNITAVHPLYFLLGLGIIASFVAFIVQLGFYLASALCLLLLILSFDYLQDRQVALQPKRLLKHFAFTASFCILMYMLFSVLLKVQIPSGVLG